MVQGNSFFDVKVVSQYASANQPVGCFKTSKPGMPCLRLQVIARAWVIARCSFYSFTSEDCEDPVIDVGFYLLIIVIIEEVATVLD